jgi:hypothetical protein
MTNRTKMASVSARRALLHPFRRRRAEEPHEGGKLPPPVFWGRIGAYEAVSRRGILFLLDPEPSHPSLRVRSGA